MLLERAAAQARALMSAMGGGYGRASFSARHCARRMCSCHQAHSCIRFAASGKDRTHRALPSVWLAAETCAVSGLTEFIEDRHRAYSGISLVRYRPERAVWSCRTSVRSARMARASPGKRRRLEALSRRIAPDVRGKVLPYVAGKGLAHRFEARGLCWAVG